MTDHSPAPLASPHAVVALPPQGVDAVQQAARAAALPCQVVELGQARSRADVLTGIAQQLAFPAHFGHNLDALYDCLTDGPTGSAPGGRVIVLHQIPGDALLDAHTRESILDCFRDAADFWADHPQRPVFCCYYSLR